MAKEALGKEEKETSETSKKLHPAAQSWNAVVLAMEQLRLAWQEHRVIFLQNKASVCEATLAEQRELRGIIHRQRFEYLLDYMVKYSNGSYKPLLLKEAQDGKD